MSKHQIQNASIPAGLSEIRAASDDVPPHIPKDRVVDITFAMGGVPNDLVDPYEAFGWLSGPDVPHLLYNAPWQNILMIAAGHKMRGNWVVTHHEDIHRVYTDNEHFSNKGQAEYQRLIGETFPTIPLAIDPPEHHKYRQFLMPGFAPSRIDKMEQQIRLRVRQMMDVFADKGEVDIAWEFNRVYPALVFMDLMGFPSEILEQFLDWEWQILHSRNLDKMKAALREVIDYLRGFIVEKQNKPGDDLTSYIAHGNIHGQPLTDDEKIGIVWLLWHGGLDTVASTLNQMFRRMALQPEIQSKLRSHPELIETAVEEFLRTQPIINSGRRAVKDFEWYGMQIKAGDAFVCLNTAGNFDPTTFTNPREFDVAREPNHHFTFVAGVHRCLGAPLARREMRILLDEWFRRIPEFRIKPGADTTVYPGLLSIRNLVIVWDTAIRG